MKIKRSPTVNTMNDNANEESLRLRIGNISKIIFGCPNFEINNLCRASNI